MKVLGLLGLFTRGQHRSLHPVHLFRTENGLHVPDGNHRLTLAQYFGGLELPADLYDPSDMYKLPSGEEIPVEDLIPRYDGYRQTSIQLGYSSYKDVVSFMFGKGARAHPTTHPAANIL